MSFLGIEYRQITKNDTQISSNNNINDNDINQIDAEDEDEAIDFDIQIKKTKILFKKEDILIEGSLALAELVDFLINQKDRSSFAILPEIYSSGPFVYGTLRSNTATFSGPCKGINGEEFYHFKVNGIVFPNSINSIVDELHTHGHKLSMTVERESNTDFLSAYLHEI